MCDVLEQSFNIYDEADFEDRIHRAFTEAVDKQTCLPLIKQELQCKIQIDRLSRGESELVLEEEVPKFYKLSDEEKRKRDARLEQNRQSAIRSRKRSKEKETSLKETVDRLFCWRRQLEKEVKKLTEEKKTALDKLKAHAGVCGNTKKKKQLIYELKRY